MKISILTLFPEMLSPLNHSIIGRAITNGKININIVNFRDFSTEKHKKVDDYVFGGGEGMLIGPQPLVDAIESVKIEKSHVIYLSPSGYPLTQSKVKELAKLSDIILICGHYEGIDQRVIDNYVDEEISIGDYILTNGEIPAMVLVDAVARLQNSILNNENSYKNESFENNLLEGPQYTRPANFRGLKVPEILLSGNHQEIEKWRKEKQIEKTKKIRPDIMRG